MAGQAAGRCGAPGLRRCRFQIRADEVGENALSADHLVVEERIIICVLVAEDDVVPLVQTLRSKVLRKLSLPLLVGIVVREDLGLDDVGPPSPHDEDIGAAAARGDLDERSVSQPLHEEADVAVE